MKTALKLWSLTFLLSSTVLSGQELKQARFSADQAARGSELYQQNCCLLLPTLPVLYTQLPEFVATGQIGVSTNLSTCCAALLPKLRDRWPVFGYLNLPAQNRRFRRLFEGSDLDKAERKILHGTPVPVSLVIPSPGTRARCRNRHHLSERRPDPQFRIREQISQRQQKSWQTLQRQTGLTGGVHLKVRVTAH